MSALYFQPTTTPAGDGGACVEWPAQRSERVSPGRLEERLLILRAQRGCGAALETLVHRHRRLVTRIASRYRCRSFTHEDLIQEGIVGLLHAIARWDQARECRLSTYAVHWIRQSIARAVEQNDRLIHLPVQSHHDIRRIAAVRESLERELRRHPSDAEVAAAAGVSEERLRALAGAADEAVSLEQVIGRENDLSLLEVTVDPEAPDPEGGALRQAYHAQLRALVRALRPRERWILEERYGFTGGHPQTLEELSRQLRVSRERVRQIEAQAIRKIRHALHLHHWD